MPDLTERKLLCRTCGEDEWDTTDYPHDRRHDHPFDGVPYVPCPECRGSGRYLLQRLYGDDVIEREESCPSCSGLGWASDA